MLQLSKRNGSLQCALDLTRSSSCDTTTKSEITTINTKAYTNGSSSDDEDAPPADQNLVLESSTEAEKLAEMEIISDMIAKELIFKTDDFISSDDEDDKIEVSYFKI